MNRYASALITLVCVVACAAGESVAESADLVGQVTRVVDGDTLELTVGPDRSIRIRLAQIDAPEKAQPYGEEATAALSALTLGKQVRVEVTDVDRYGRSVGEIYLIGDDGGHVNFEMVRQGHAWAYTRYAKSVVVIELEDEARGDERGLWKLPSAERDPPWLWRKGKRGKSTAESDRAAADTTCGAKRTCKEMVSCAEARFYLLECGLTRLDGDGDGNPCESKCRQ